MSRRLAVRLPLLAALVLGAWLWQSSLFPQTRELVLLLPPAGTPLTFVELQLYDESGELLKREQWSIPEPGDAPSVLRTRLPLRRGRYQCRVFLRDAASGERALRETLDVDDLPAYELELKPPRPGP